MKKIGTLLIVMILTNIFLSGAGLNVTANNTKSNIKNIEINQNRLIKIHSEYEHSYVKELSNIGKNNNFKVINRDERIAIGTLKTDIVIKTNHVPIFDINDLRKTFMINSDNLKSFILSKGKPVLASLSPYIANTANKYGLNPIFLTSLIANESTWATSDLAVNLNNLGGIKYKGKYKYFNNKEECIDYMARLLVKDYMTEGGEYYTGRFGLYDINSIYCPTGYEWSETITDISNDLLNYLQ